MPPFSSPLRRVIVCGGRDFHDADQLARILDKVHAASPIAQLVTGAAPGADTLAGEWARRQLALSSSPEPIALEEHPADWGVLGKKAGPMRNEKMAELGAHLCVVFAGGAGTDNMRACAKKHGIPILHVPTYLELQERLDGFLPAIAKMNASAATPEQRAKWQAKRYEQQQAYQRAMDQLTPLFGIGPSVGSETPADERSHEDGHAPDGQRLTVRLGE